MANYTGGAEWGRFVKETDPTRNLTDAFLTSFKEGIAYKLAEKKTKAEEAQKKQEQKALEDYRNLQMMMKQVEMQQKQEQQKIANAFREREVAVKEKEKEVPTDKKKEFENFVYDLQLKVANGTANEQEKKQLEELRKIDQQEGLTEYQKQQLALQWWKAGKQYEEEEVEEIPPGVRQGGGLGLQPGTLPKTYQDLPAGQHSIIKDKEGAKSKIQKLYQAGEEGTISRDAVVREVTQLANDWGISAAEVAGIKNVTIKGAYPNPQIR